ncbi:MAG: hypothetical protein R2832_11900 [Rhodothermales bacterium]
MRALRTSQDVELSNLEEESRRSIYAAFFANLPESLKSRGLFNEESFEWQRFFNLASAELGKRFNTSDRSYSLAGGAGDSLWFSLIPYARTSDEAGRESVMDAYYRVSRAIDLIDPSEKKLAEARRSMEVFKDSLDAILSGRR